MMGWSIGYDDNWKRDIGYGVPATCDHPGCGKEIDRGLAYVCGGRPYGGDIGCGLFFCYEHLWLDEKEDSSGEIECAQLCARCREDLEPFEPTPDVQEWIDWKETDDSWAEWRKERDESNR